MAEQLLRCAACRRLLGPPGDGAVQHGTAGYGSPGHPPPVSVVQRVAQRVKVDGVWRVSVRDEPVEVCPDCAGSLPRG
jgi:hypothetical protein